MRPRRYQIEQTDQMPPTGLEAALIDNREALLRFMRARGAGDAAEDLLHDLWLKIAGAANGPVGAPLPYLYRAANMLMIDRYRSRRQSDQREQDWIEAEGGVDGEAADTPSGERVLSARQEVEQVSRTLAALGWRRETVFRRARIDGVPQKAIAQELGVSLSTVESDLRAACVALADLKRELQ